MTQKRKTFAFLDKINNRWDFFAWAITDKLWPIIAIIVVAGLMVSGFTFKSGKTEFKKDPIQLKDSEAGK